MLSALGTRPVPYNPEGSHGQIPEQQYDAVNWNEETMIIRGSVSAPGWLHGRVRDAEALMACRAQI